MLKKRIHSFTAVCQKMSGLLWPFETSQLATLLFTKCRLWRICLDRSSASENLHPLQWKYPCGLNFSTSKFLEGQWIVYCSVCCFLYFSDLRCPFHVFTFILAAFQQAHLHMLYLRLHGSQEEDDQFQGGHRIIVR